jgi:hypothetical protein
VSVDRRARTKDNPTIGPHAAGICLGTDQGTRAPNVFYGSRSHRDRPICFGRPFYTRGLPKMPQRIRLQRTRGWRKPPEAVVVARPSRWGNPFVATGNNREEALRSYRLQVEQRLQCDPAWLEPLRGRDLVCWCRLDEPCHADVLLEFANRKTRRA